MEALKTSRAKINVGRRLTSPEPSAVARTMRSSTLFSAARSVFRRTARSARRQCTRGSDHVYGSSSFACLSPHPSPRSSRHRYTYFIGNAARRLPKSKPRLLLARTRAPCLPGLTAGRRGRTVLVRPAWKTALSGGGRGTLQGKAPGPVASDHGPITQPQRHLAPSQI